MLDQDEQLMSDISTYSWLVGFAENILDQEEAITDAVKRGNKS